ncbi:MAG: ABC transporter ATP-binding protein [Chloroflexia bacterium]
MTEPLLRVEDLVVEFRTPRGVLRAVDGVSFEIFPRESFGLVGETGCGKTVTGLSILRLVPRPGRIVDGRVWLEDMELTALPEAQLQHIRGGRVAMIFQDPACSLNPVFTIGSQIVRVIRRHQPMTRREAEARALEVLEAVGLPDARRLLGCYPHELSGGMQQRVMIAMALSCRPSLLIADEPTTALDVTIEAQILALLRELQQRYGIAMLLITHDLGIIAETCSRVAVLYAGRVVESGPTEEIFLSPCHPYTQGLMAAIPQPGSRGRKLRAIPGTVPANPGTLRGCAFSPRCSRALERCHSERPPQAEVSPGHRVACFLARTEESQR